MSTRHKRGNRRCVDVDVANKHHNNYLMDRRQSAIDDDDVGHSSSCEDDTNISSITRGATTVRNNNQRFCYQIRIIHTCTMLGITLLILSGSAIHHATAFVTRIAGRSLLKSSTTIKDWDDGSSYHYSKEPTLLQAATNSRSRMRITSKNRHNNYNNNDIPQLPSSTKLQMSSSDMEVQSSQNTDQSSSSGGGDDNDEHEWRTVLAAFQMYKAAYGDLKVPSRFIVPGMAPWPGKFGIYNDSFCMLPYSDSCMYGRGFTTIFESFSSCLHFYHIRAQNYVL